MQRVRFWCGAVGMAAILCAAAAAQSQSQAPPSPTTTLQVTSKLVFLDVTVLDKKGHPVVSGLAKDDFTITEGKMPQRIFSFEAPGVHSTSAGASADNPDGNAPHTILVLDQLNSSFQDFAYIRWEVQRYLEFQPKELQSPTELMLAGNNSLELVQSYTRNREELLSALKHIPAAIPYKMSGSFWAERLAQSFDALNQIALENGGFPGRKNIIWVGHGSPGINTVFLDSRTAGDLQQYAHMITNLLVDARISLFVIYPGLPAASRRSPMGSEMDAELNVGDDGPFATTGDINFGVFVDETGGKLFYNRNDLDQEMRDSEQIGSEYYTLTYQPHGGDDNGRFRRIRVTMRDPNLRAVTKLGYYAPDKNAPLDPRMHLMQTVVEAARSTIPFDALHIAIGNLVRHPDTETVQLTGNLRAQDLNWLPSENGMSRVDLIIAAASLNDYRNILTSRLQGMEVTASTDKLAHLGPGDTVAVTFTLRIPKKAKSVRVVMETENGGRIGTAEVGRKAIDAAPAEPTPQPQLAPPRNFAPNSAPIPAPNSAPNSAPSQPQP